MVIPIRTYFKLLLSTVLSLMFLIKTDAQQMGDISFRPKVQNPVYAKGKGPTVVIDEAHNNFHTKEGRFKPFASVLESDGYKVESGESEFSYTSLSSVEILVIANALNQKNLNEWSLPTPSAFTNKEIEEVTKWVEKGGSLFLIADHMPFPGAAEELAKAFGFTFYNGFALRTDKRQDIFSIKNNGLKVSTITQGRPVDKEIVSIRSFTGQCFEALDDARPILVLDDHYVNRMPETAWEFEKNTETVSAKDFLQGAYMMYGEGRIVVFGEAAMFTSQQARGNKFGMSAPNATQNMQLLLNIMHWLDGTLE